MSDIKVTGFLKPAGSTDTYPTHIDNFGKGGVHTVATIALRDAITQERRSVGMFAYVQQDAVLYVLVGGIDNQHWTKFIDFSSGEPTHNLELGEGYTYVGGKDGLAFPSLMLRDMEIDIQQIRISQEYIEKTHFLKYKHLWVGNAYNEPTSIRQINLDHMPILGAALFPFPGDSTVKIPIPNPTWSILNPLDWFMSSPWLPQIYAGSVDPSTGLLWKETSISSNLACTQINIAQAVKRIENTAFIVKTRKATWEWENILTNKLPAGVKQLYNLQSEYTYGTHVQALDELKNGLVKTVNGDLSIATHGRAIDTDYVAPADLLESEADILSQLDEAIAVLEGEIVALQGEIAAIQSELLIGEVSIAAAVTGLQSEVSALNNASVYVGTNDSHIIGSGYITPSGYTPRVFPLNLKSTLKINEHQQSLIFQDPVSEESQLTLKVMNDEATQVKPITFSAMSVVRHIDLIQPSGEYFVYRGFKLQTQYQADDLDTSVPASFRLKYLKYKDNAYYNSLPELEEDIFVYDVQRNMLDIYPPIYLPIWTTFTRPASPLAGFFGFNSDDAVIEWFDGFVWVRANSGGGGSVNVTGTQNQINVVTDTDISTISIADNAILPGFASITVPKGTNLQRPAVSQAQLRFNTDTLHYEGSDATKFRTMCYIDDVPTIAGSAQKIFVLYDDINNKYIISIADNAVLPGSSAVTIPRGSDAQRPVQPVSGNIRYNLSSNKYEGYTEYGAWDILNRSVNGTTDQIIVSTNADSSIATISFVENPRFLGSGFVQIAVGTTLERPASPVNGMIRFNLTLDKYEGYSNESGWLSLTSAYSTINGTANQIVITQSADLSTTTVKFADNAILPGTGAVTIPAGTVAQKPANSDGLVRYTTDTTRVEYCGSNFWYELATLADIQVLLGTQNQIVITTATPVPIGNQKILPVQKTFAIADNPVLPGTGAVTIPAGTTAQRPANKESLFRYNYSTKSIEWNNGARWVSPITSVSPQIPVVEVCCVGDYTNLNLGGHIPYDRLVVHANNNNDIDIDVSSPYTLGPGPSLGRFKFLKRGVYEVEFPSDCGILGNGIGYIDLCIAGSAPNYDPGYNDVTQNHGNRVTLAATSAGALYMNGGGKWIVHTDLASWLINVYLEITVLSNTSYSTVPVISRPARLIIKKIGSEFLI